MFHLHIFRHQQLFHFYKQIWTNYAHKLKLVNVQKVDQIKILSFFEKDKYRFVMILEAVRLKPSIVQTDQLQQSIITKPNSKPMFIHNYSSHFLLHFSQLLIRHCSLHKHKVRFYSDYLPKFSLFFVCSLVVSENNATIDSN